MVNKITKPEGVVDFFTAIKCIFQPFWAFLQAKMTGLLILSYRLLPLKFPPYRIDLKPEKGTPLGQSLPLLLYRPLWGVTPLPQD